MSNFWGNCDFVDQSIKLGAVGSYDVLSNFRRGATSKSPGIVQLRLPPEKLKPIIKIYFK